MAMACNVYTGTSAVVWNSWIASSSSVTATTNDTCWAAWTQTGAITNSATTSIYTQTVWSSWNAQHEVVQETKRQRAARDQGRGP